LSAAPASTFTAASLAGVRHGFFGRQGGISTGIYASLNAGTGSNDDAAAVRENRRRIAAAMDVDHLVGVHQVHSAHAVFVDAPWPGERPHADALVTATSGLALSVLTADCAPILMADREAGVVAAAHAGWKGALGGVIESTVELMRAHGAAPARISAAIGPCIHQASYEVGPEFRARFIDADAATARFFAAGVGEKFLFDLPGFCAARLAAAGVTRNETAPLDTYAHAELCFSHRRSVHRGDADYGRNCAAIAL
jgi:YfiH family protein